TFPQNLPQSSEREQRVLQVVVDPEEQDDVEVAPSETSDVVDGNVRKITNLRPEQRVSQPESRLIRVVAMPHKVRRDNVRGPAPLGLERPEAIPAADVEHGLSPEVHPVECLEQEARRRPPAPRRLNARSQVDRVDPLKVRNALE